MIGIAKPTTGFGRALSVIACAALTHPGAAATVIRFDAGVDAFHPASGESGRTLALPANTSAGLVDASALRMVVTALLADARIRSTDAM